MDVGDGSGTGREARAGGGAIRGSEERARQGIAQGRKEREGTPSRAQMGRLGAPSLVPPAPPLSAELLASLSEAGRRFVTCIGAPGRSLHGGGAEGGADASGDADAGDGASVGGGVGDATGAGAAERKKAGASGKNGAGSAVESAVSAEAGVGVGAGTSAGEDAAGRKRSVASVKASAGVQAGVGGAGDSSPSGEAADVGVGLSEIVVYPASHHVSTEKVCPGSSHKHQFPPHPPRPASSHLTSRLFSVASCLNTDGASNLLHRKGVLRQLPSLASSQLHTPLPRLPECLIRHKPRARSPLPPFPGRSASASVTPSGLNSPPTPHQPPVPIPPPRLRRLFGPPPLPAPTLVFRSASAS